MIAESHARARVGKKHIDDILNLDLTKLDELVEMFTALVEDDWKLKKDPKVSKRKVTSSLTDSVDPKRVKVTRTRRMWTGYEDEVLVRGRIAGDSWVTISKRLKPGRSNGDCRCRFVNLIKIYGSKDVS